MLEVDIAALSALAKPIYGVKELPRFPAVSRDIAIVVKESARAGDMLDCIQKAGGKTLEEARLFDVYRGEKLGAGKKSVAYALTFRAADRTLTDAEIQNSMDKILKALETGFGAEIRK